MNLEPELEQVRREYLRRMTQGDNTLLRQVEDYISARNGKMLRPRLLLTAAATRGDEALRSRRTQLLAVCVEMLHNASLLHDDIIDRADTRRGQPSVNARWGNATAVLVGDWILAQIMRLLDEVDDRQATRLVNNTVIDMVQAELLQLQSAETENEKGEMRNEKDSEPERGEGSGSLRQPDPIDPSFIIHHSSSIIENYLRIIDGKTARLFATACALGNPDYEDFGLHYGRLFQMRDDLADGEAPAFAQELIEQETQEINNLKYKLTI